MTLRIYNTLTRQKEVFEPIAPGEVRMYTCGPTVYKPAHIGHMVGPVVFDTVRRYFEFHTYRVLWVLNITDVDDKLIQRAREEGTTVAELAERNIADYKECLNALRVARITHMPRATEHIPDMIQLIEGLIAKGHAYAVQGDVYFDVTSDPDYGKLCHRDPEQMAAGARIEVSDKKRHPGDFALWKAAKPGEPAWNSPWGQGRPGWHIECSAMSMHYLGPSLDIHGGGLDLQFPHHENELAQSECFTGKPFVRYWMHNGLLKMGQTKMAGSLGNVVNVRDLLRAYPGETLRFFILATHYRSPIEFSDERLQEVHRSLQAFYRFAERYRLITGESFYEVPALAKVPLIGSDYLAEAEHLRRSFLEAMDDDFNTARCIGVLFELLALLNRYADRERLEDPAQRRPESVEHFKKMTRCLVGLSSILGLFEAPPKAERERVLEAAPAHCAVAGEPASLDVAPRLPISERALLDLLVEIRGECRKLKHYALADRIRQRLAELGVVLEDRPGGTVWRIEETIGSRS